MRRPHKRGTLAALLAATIAAAGALAQEPQAPEGPVELRRAMEEYFQTRMQAEVSLSDEQLEQILPLVRQRETSRRAALRTRQDSVRRLRRGLEQGATDSELQTQLDRLDASEREQWESERSVQKQVDGVMSTRQRVQMRFFLQSFRRDMQGKIRELRGERGGMRRPPRSQRP